jgi:hypothetical protein
MKIYPAGAELFDADRQKDMLKLAAASRNFAKAPQNLKIILVTHGVVNYGSVP